MRGTALLHTARAISSIHCFDAISNIQLSRSVSSAAGSLLYRDFIQQSLYHPVQGYFNKPQPPICRLSQPINFNRILNQAEYKSVLSRIYKQLKVDWLTPVEVFAPWYGRALARYMLECRQHTLHTANQPLAIVEIGGGTGTLAASILDYIAEKEPVTYSCMSYTTIEISASLAGLQQQLVVEQRGHAQAWRCVSGDAATPQAWADVVSGLPPQQSAAGHAFVVMMEVMDNLPHDRVVRSAPGAAWQQVVVQQQQQPGHSSSSSRSSRSMQEQQQHSYVEALQPADDPLVQRCLQAMYPQEGNSSSALNSSSSSRVKSWLQHVLGLPDADSDPTDVWLPTRCLQLLEVLHAKLPSHTLIAADFDALPDVTVPGKNAPLVSGREGPGVTVDHDTVLVPWGSADIFFPTDFDGLTRLYESAAVTGPQVHAAAAAAALSAGSSKGAAGAKQRQQQQQQGAAPGSSRAASCSHSSTADFMSSFAEAKATRLLSGYNPLVQDWDNTRVFVGQSLQPK